MPRRSRITIPGAPHHVVQRGCRRQTVFFNDVDRQVYLNLLTRFSRKYGVHVLAYCLMSNHPHLVLVPEDKDSIRWTVQLTHKQFAEYVNAQNNWTGHLWQQRYYSSPLDEKFLWVCIRYVERNPVAAGLVEHPAMYPWSSAPAHCGLREDPVLTTDPFWNEVLMRERNWVEWISQEEDPANVQTLKMSTGRHEPCGSSDFKKKIVGM